MTAPPPTPPPPPPPPRGSIPAAMNWMGCLTLVLFWLPVVGPFLAGLVGGVKAGTAGRAAIAVFLPAVMTGVMVAVGVTWLTHLAFWGTIAGLGGLVLSLLNVGPLLAGALLGGLWGQWTRRGYRIPTRRSGPR